MRGKGNMERLTVEYCGEYVPRELCSIDRLGGADDCDLCCEYCKATEEDTQDCTECAIGKCFNKLGEYENLEEQGKLLKLPCAVGDTLYCDGKYFASHCKGKIHSFKVSDIVTEIKSYYRGEVDYCFDFENVGKTVFLTREEAEAALKELKEVEVG